MDTIEVTIDGRIVGIETTAHGTRIKTDGRGVLGVFPTTPDEDAANGLVAIRVAVKQLRELESSLRAGIEGGLRPELTERLESAIGMLEHGLALQG